MNETIRHFFFVILSIIAIGFLFGFIYWGIQFSPWSVCEANGGDWDNVYVKCVEEGQTFWDRHTILPEPCDCCCCCGQEQSEKKCGG